MGALEPILKVAKCCRIDDFIASIADMFTLTAVLIDIRLFIFSPVVTVWRRIEEVEKREVRWRPLLTARHSEAQRCPELIS